MHRERRYEEPNEQAYAKIAKAKFAVEGTSTYPDATFTLRLAFGAGQGLRGGRQEGPVRDDVRRPVRTGRDRTRTAPRSICRSAGSTARTKLNLKTPFNFVCTADIIGGNSGSPVINRNGEVVGLIFDGNIQSLVLDFVYTDDVARAVSVHSQAIPEALRAIYDADALASEIVIGSRK